MEKRKRTMELWNKLRTALYYEKRANRKDTFQITMFPQDTFICKEKPFIRYYLKGSTDPFLTIRKREGMVTKNQISESSKTHVDITGIIKIWPCEELLAYYCYKNIRLFEHFFLITDYYRGKHVCELGSGYSGLAGLTIRKLCKSVEKVVITDGNEVSVKKLRKNIEQNMPMTGITAATLVWDTGFKAPEKFDIIVVADCLFCAHMHADLIHTIVELMHEKSVCIIIAPRRKGTLDAFLGMAEKIPGLNLKVGKEVTEEVDMMIEGVKNNPFYKEDEHQPYLIVITRQ